MKIIGYHGSQTKYFEYEPDRALYFTTDKQQAESYAKREWDEGLIEGQLPVVYTAEINIDKPLIIEDSDKFFDFCDSSMNEYLKDEIINSGYDSAIYDDKKHNTKLIAVFNENQFEIIKKEILPKSYKYYYPRQGGINPDDVDEYYYDELDESYEDEDLTRFNRIAGFYHLDTKQFELFPRTTSNISDEDENIHNYIHDIHSAEEFKEFRIVRFGIEDIPGEGVVCYIEGDTKNNVEKCYNAILDEYANDIQIIKYELEYYVNNKMRMITYNSYGEEIMESANELQQVNTIPNKLYHATYNKLWKKIRKCGYLGNSPYKMWEDSNNKYVYLATEPDVAESYVETALDDLPDRLYDMLEDDDIVILEIDVSKLDKSKLNIDRNVQDNDGSSYQYEGVIPLNAIKVYNEKLEEATNENVLIKNDNIFMEFNNNINLKTLKSKKIVVETKLWINDKILYHGTNRNFDTFKPSKKGTFGKGIYLTPNPAVAKTYGNKLIKVKVNLKNPLYISHEMPENISNLIMYNKIDELQKMGYDGIINGDENYCSEVVVWNPKDIKIIKETENSDWDGKKLNETIENKLPNVNSLGQPIAKDNNSLRNFWKWFGDSKVVDKQGRPLVVYHGTDAEFDTFDKSTIGKNHIQSVGGFFFTDRKNHFGKNNMMTYLSMKNPLIISVYDYAIEWFDDHRSDVLQEADLNGNDGVIIKSDEKADEDMYLAFNPNQIKSVNNNGNWSNESNNINESQQLNERLYPEISDDTYDYILSSTAPDGKANAYTKWFAQQYLKGDFNFDDDLHQICNKHKILRDAGQVKSIMDYNSMDELLNDLKQDYQTNSEKNKVAAKGAKLIGQIGDYKIYNITTWDAAKKYGYGTRWCVTDFEDNKHFKRYVYNKPELNARGYLWYFISKDKKYAISIDYSISRGWVRCVINLFNDFDDNIGTYNLLSQDGCRTFEGEDDFPQGEFQKWKQFAINKLGLDKQGLRDKWREVVDEEDGLDESKNNDLSESVSKQYLYHGTTLETAQEIMWTDELSGSTDIGNEQYGVSLTRNLKYAQHFAEYKADTIGDYGIVIFEFDYQQLRQHYKIRPYYDMSDSMNKSNGDKLQYNEFEEVLVGDIKPLSKYVTNIYIDEVAKERILDDEELAKDFENAKLLNGNEIIKTHLSESKEIIDESSIEDLTSENIDKAVEMVADELFDHISDDDLKYDYDRLTRGEKNSIRQELGMEEQSIYGEEINDVDYVIEQIVEMTEDIIGHNRPLNRLPQAIYQFIYGSIKGRLLYGIRTLIEEFGKHNKIYRMITTDLEPQQLIEFIKENGLGNCWAKSGIEYTMDYCAQEKGKYHYVFEGVTDLNDINWIKTIYLRFVMEEEDEIRLKSNAKVQLLNIYQAEYDSNDYQPIDITPLKYDLIPVGNKFLYEQESESY